MVKRYYLAYGSNLNMEQMKFRCPNAKPVGTAIIENNVLTFRGSGSGFYLTVEPKIGSKVPVGVWEVTAADEAALDRYEGLPKVLLQDRNHGQRNPLRRRENSKQKGFLLLYERGQRAGLA